MAKNQISIALFGLGRIGQMHAKNLINNKNFNLKYIYDIDRHISKRLSNKFSAIDVKNPEIIFKDKEIECIFISSPTPSHLKLIEKAAKVKKVIFCEKPLDLNVVKILKYKKIISRYNPKIQMGFNRRYDPGHNALKNNLNLGKIGNLEKIIITSRDPAPPSLSYLKNSGGIFKDMMIHDFDLIRFYLEKDEVSSIFATASNMSDKRFKKIRDFELATAVIKSKKGVQCIITNSRHCSFGYDQRIELFGDKGMIISDNKRNTEISLYSKNSTDNKNKFMNFFIERYKEAYKLQLTGLEKLCKKGTKPLAGFDDGLKSLIVAETAIKSIISKKFEKIKF